jgi:hypothetical protein
MNKGYQEFIVFMRNWLNQRNIEIVEEIHDPRNDDFTFVLKIGESFFELEIQDGFNLSLKIGNTMQTIFVCLENNFDALDLILQTIKKAGK